MVFFFLPPPLTHLINMHMYTHTNGFMYIKIIHTQIMANKTETFLHKSDLCSEPDNPIQIWNQYTVILLENINHHSYIFKNIFYYFYVICMSVVAACM